MIAAYIVNDEVIFLDATDQKTKYGLPSSFIQGKEAMIWTGGDTYRLETVPVVAAEDNLSNYVINARIEESKIVGEGRLTMDGIDRSHNLSRMSTMNDKKRFNSIKGKASLGNNKFKLFDHTEANVDERDSLYKLTFDFSLDNYIVNLDEETYVNLFLKDLSLVDEFDEDREFPFHFEYALNYNTTVFLEIPEGKEVSSLEEPMLEENESFIFTSIYTLEDDMLKLNYQIKLKDIYVQPKHFSDWNESVKKIKKYMKKSIIIK